MQIMNTKIRGEYPAPNNVILSRAVHLTARGMQIQRISVAKITVQDDCTLLVDFLVDAAAQIAAECDNAAIIAHAQARLVSQGIPLTSQRLVRTEGISFDASVNTSVRIQCHLFVEPQNCPTPDRFSFGPRIRISSGGMKVQLKAFRAWQGESEDGLGFIEGQHLWGRSGADFLRNLYLQFPWYQHWLLKDAYYQTSAVAADGKSVWVNYQPFQYGFGAISAPACNMGVIGDLLFTHALRPVMFTC